MKNDRMFLRCNTCGNIVGMIEDGGITPVCCDEEMELLIANTTDATQEKHVPVAKRNGNDILVSVGEAAHPMTQEHHISWIAIAGKNQTHRVTLENTAMPEAAFCLANQGEVTIYAYCNLHGLWASEA